MSFVIFTLRLVVVVAFLNSCTPSKQKSAQETQSAQVSETTDASQTEEVKKETDAIKNEEDVSTTSHYPITGQRPQEICGEQGFAYLWQGFFVPECGTCHYPGNSYGVAAFADREQQQASFQAILAIETESLLEFVTKNPFCIRCNLKADDPLLKDISHFMEHKTICEQVAN